MTLGLLTLFVALSISAVAAFYSIVGLMAIFSAAAFEIALMGGVLEVGKLVTASWLYQNWKLKTVPKILKTYLTLAVVVLVFITSIGIFGFLSKAHLDQVQPNVINQTKIESLITQINREKQTIERANTVLEQLDAAVDKYIQLEFVTKGLEEREKQRKDRQLLSETIDASTQKIAQLEESKFQLLSEQQAIEAEVGPLKYVAELIYGDQASSHFDHAVRIIIMIFIFVFDPLAVLLLIAANITLRKTKILKTSRRVSTPVAKRARIKVQHGREKTTLKEDTEDFGEIRKVTRTDGDVSSVHYE